MPSQRQHFRSTVRVEPAGAAAAAIGDRAPAIARNQGARKAMPARHTQCQRCVMDTSDPEITFDAQGFCNHCRDYFVRLAECVYQGEDDRRFADAIAQMKRAGRGKRYDCVIGLSGGADSCYVAYLLNQHDVRVLAVHMDNGWDSEISVKNIKRVVEALGVDYQSYVLDWEQFRQLQVAFLKASVPEAETPTDIAIFGALHRVAAEHGVKFVVSGGNYATEGILPKSWHYNAKDTRYLQAIAKQFGSARLRSFPTFGWLAEGYYKLVRGMRIIYPLNYVRYDRPAVRQKLEQEFGWRPYSGKHHESRYTALLHSYILPTKFDIDYRKATLSTEICAGSISRAEALEVLAKEPFRREALEEDLDYLCKKLELTRSQFEAVLRAPPKTHRDYPNDERALELVYRVYRALFRSPSRAPRGA